MQSIADLLRLNAQTAMRLAFDGLKDSGGGFERAELSVLLCNDEFIRKRNKEWRGEDQAIDVLFKSHVVPDLKLPTVRTSIFFSTF